MMNSDARPRPIPGSAYAVTMDGAVISPSGRPLKPFRGDRNGHLKVCIDQGRREYVHRLVALTFLGEATSGNEVRHLNGNPRDNHISNLAYGSRSENVLDSVAHGTYRNSNAEKTHCPRGHEYSNENTYVNAGKRRCRTCRRGGK